MNATRIDSQVDRRGRPGQVVGLDDVAGRDRVLRLDDAADLGPDAHLLVEDLQRRPPRPRELRAAPAEARAEPRLGDAEAVVRRRVEVAEPDLDAPLHDRLGLVVAQLLDDAAQGRRAHQNVADGEVGGLQGQRARRRRRRRARVARRGDDEAGDDDAGDGDDDRQRVDHRETGSGSPQVNRRATCHQVEFIIEDITPSHPAAGLSRGSAPSCLAAGSARTELSRHPRGPHRPWAPRAARRQSQ